MPATKALALWGGSSLLVATAGLSATLVLHSPSAAEVSGGSTSPAKAPQDKPKDKKPAPGKALTAVATAPTHLIPGENASLVVSITNPNSQAVRLTQVAARVDSVIPATCSASWFTITSSTASTVIPAGATEDVVLALSLDDLLATNQDACKNATYAFSFDVAGRQA